METIEIKILGDIVEVRVYKIDGNCIYKGRIEDNELLSETDIKKLKDIYKKIIKNIWKSLA